MKIVFLAVVVMALGAGHFSWADDEPQNCKLTARIIATDGEEKKATVKVETKHADSQQQCKLLGEEMRVKELQNKKVTNVIVSAGWRGDLK